MPALTEGVHAGEFLTSEANGSLSREIVTIASGLNLAAATVLAQRTSAGGAGAANAGNAGDGTISAIVVSAGVKQGVYTVTFIEPEADAGTFTVEDPDGVNVGTGTVGVEFSGGGVTFTISDGATDFVAGDGFAVTVSVGTGEYTQLDPAGTDGSANASALLYRAVDTTDAAKKEVIVTRQAEVVAELLVWPDGISAGDKATAIEQLAERGIILR